MAPSAIGCFQYAAPTSHVRGGSVSRRGLTQAYRKRTHFQAEPAPESRTPPNASRSSGERGLGGEALLSEKRPLPPESPVRPPHSPVVLTFVLWYTEGEWRAL